MKKTLTCTCDECCVLLLFFFFKQKAAYEMRISDWSSDVCSSDLPGSALARELRQPQQVGLITTDVEHHQHIALAEIEYLIDPVGLLILQMIHARKQDAQLHRQIARQCIGKPADHHTHAPSPTAEPGGALRQPPPPQPPKLP